MLDVINISRSILMSSFLILSVLTLFLGLAKKEKTGGAILTFFGIVLFAFSTFSFLLPLSSSFFIIGIGIIGFVWFISGIMIKGIYGAMLIVFGSVMIGFTIFVLYPRGSYVPL